MNKRNVFAILTLFTLALCLSFISGLGCTDTDGGYIYLQGSVEDENGEKTDYCFSESILREYYCSEDQVTFRDVNCPSGYICKDGACAPQGVGLNIQNNWTKWYDRDTPDQEGFDGYDDETLYSLNKDGENICNGYWPIDMEVRNVDSGAKWSYSEYKEYVRKNFNDDKTHYHDYFNEYTSNTDNVRSLAPNEGFLCKGDLGDKCRDYEVRFKCGDKKMPESYDGPVYWTEWHNTDNSKGIWDSTEDESLDKIRKKGYNVCDGEKPIDIQAKNADSGATWTFSDMPSPMRLKEDFFKGLDNTDNILAFSPTEGLVCEDQVFDSCRDYEVRFLCKKTREYYCEDTDGGKNIYEAGSLAYGVINSRFVDSDECLGPFSGGGYGNYNPKDKVTEYTCNETAVEKGDFRNIAVYERISCNPLEDYEYGYRCFEGECVPVDKRWTEWFSRDNGKGDYDDESLDKLREEGNEICGGSDPIDIELSDDKSKRILRWSDFKTSGLSIDEAFGRNLFSTKINKFSPTEGFVCEKNFGNECANYRVRFLCSEEESIEQKSGNNCQGYYVASRTFHTNFCEEGEVFDFGGPITLAVFDESKNLIGQCFGTQALNSATGCAGWRYGESSLNREGSRFYEDFKDVPRLNQEACEKLYEKILYMQVDAVNAGMPNAGRLSDVDGIYFIDLLNFEPTKRKISNPYCFDSIEGLDDVSEKDGFNAPDGEGENNYDGENAGSANPQDDYQGESGPNVEEGEGPELKSANGCEGCELDGQCYTYGFVKDGMYCSSIDSTFVDQKETGEACEKNHECSSGICAGSTCVSGSTWDRFLGFFTKFFK